MEAFKTDIKTLHNSPLPWFSHSTHFHTLCPLYITSTVVLPLLSNSIKEDLDEETAGSVQFDPVAQPPPPLPPPTPPTLTLSILYHDTYATPVLYITPPPSLPLTSLASAMNKPEAFSIDRHPVTGEGCLFHHPCRTGDVLRGLEERSDGDSSDLFSYLSLTSTLVPFPFRPADFKSLCVAKDAGVLPPPPVAGPRTRILDGGLSTQLAHLGVDLTHHPKLWTAGLLSTTSGVALIEKAHGDFIAAGADIILTSSYQTNPSMPQNLLTTSLTAALASRDESHSPVEVYLSLGPYGATLADGSEYTGVYPETVTEETLYTFHRTRLGMLLSERGGEVDGLAFETVPSVMEAGAVVRVLEENPGTAGWVTFTSPDGVHCSDGTLLSDAVDLCIPSFVASSAPRYVGLNCVAPSVVSTFLEMIVPVIKANPGAFAGVVLYPNLGGTWNAVSRCWSEEKGAGFEEVAVEWRKAIVEGAGVEAIIGGCCGTDAEMVGRLGRALRKEEVARSGGGEGEGGGREGR